MKIANVNIITDAAKLDANIADVARKGKTLDNLIHRTGVSCMYHAREHGDTRKLVALVDAMPRASRRKALVAWIEAHVPVDEDGTSDSKDGYTLKLAKGRKPEDFNLEAAAATPFWDFTRERAPVAMTIERAVTAFEKALAKAVKDGTASKAQVAAISAALTSGVSAANDATADAAADAASQAQNDAAAA